jgi:hypothetical protein
MKKTVIIVSIVLGTGAISYFIITAVKKSNIQKRLEENYKNPDSQETAGGMNKLLSSGAFNPTTYQTGGKATITLMEARERAKQVWDNYSSWFSSDQLAIVNAFNGLGHIQDVSKISHEFEESYEESLLEVLNTAVTDKAKMNMLIAKINKLPNN